MLTTALGGGNLVTLMLQIRKLKHKEVKQHTQDQAADKRQGKYWNSVLWDTEAHGIQMSFRWEF